MICLHDAQRKQHIVLNDAGVHLFDGRLVFSRGGNGSSLSATHLPPSILHGGRTAVYGSPPASFSSISGEGVVPSPPPGFQLTISDVVPFMVSSFQPVLVDAVASLMYGFPPASADAASVVSTSRALQRFAPYGYEHFPGCWLDVW